MASETKEEEKDIPWAEWSEGMNGELFSRHLLEEYPFNRFALELNSVTNERLKTHTEIPASPFAYVREVVRDLLTRIKAQCDKAYDAFQHPTRPNILAALEECLALPFAQTTKIAIDLRKLNFDWRPDWGDQASDAFDRLLTTLKRNVDAMTSQHAFIVRRVLTRLRRPRNRYAHGTYVGQRSENPRDAVPVPPAPLPTTVRRRDPAADHEDENRENENAPFHPYRPLQGADPGALSGMGFAADPGLATVTNEWIHAMFQSKSRYAYEHHFGRIRHGVVKDSSEPVWTDGVHKGLLDSLQEAFIGNDEYRDWYHLPAHTKAAYRRRFAQKLIHVFRPTNEFEADFRRYLKQTYLDEEGGKLSGGNALDTWANKAIFKGNVEKILASPEYRGAKKHFIEHRTNELLGPAQQYIGLASAAANRVLPGSGQVLNKANDVLEQAMKPSYEEETGGGFADDPTLATVTNDWVQRTLRLWPQYATRHHLSNEAWLESQKNQYGELPAYYAHMPYYNPTVHRYLLDFLLDQFDENDGSPRAEKRLRFVRKLIEVLRPTDGFEADFLRFLKTHLPSYEAAADYDEYAPHHTASASSDLAGQKRPRGMGFDAAESAPSAGIAQQEAVALSGQQVTHDAGGGIRVVRYPDLSKFASWQDLVNTPHKAAAILFLTTSEHSGHWICAFEGPDGAHVFDPLGLALDAERFKISSAARSELNENTPQLQRLLDSSRQPIHVSRMDFQKNAPNINTCGRWVATRLQYRNLTDEAFQALVAAGVRSARCTPDEWVTAHTEAGGAPVHAALGSGIRDTSVTDKATRQHVLMRHLYKIPDGPDAFQTHKTLKVFTKSAHSLNDNVRGGAIPKNHHFQEYYVFSIGIFECIILVFQQPTNSAVVDLDEPEQKTFVFKAMIAPEYIYERPGVFSYSDDTTHFRGLGSSRADVHRSSKDFYNALQSFEYTLPIVDLERVYIHADHTVTNLGPSKTRQDSIRWKKARIGNAIVNNEAFPMCVILFKQTGDNTAIMNVGCNIHDEHTVTELREPTGAERAAGQKTEFESREVKGLQCAHPFPSDTELKFAFARFFTSWLKKHDGVVTDDLKVQYLTSTPKDLSHTDELTVDARAVGVELKPFQRVQNAFGTKTDARNTLLLTRPAYATTLSLVKPFPTDPPQVNEHFQVPPAARRHPVLHTRFLAAETLKQHLLQFYIHCKECVDQYGPIGHSPPDPNYARVYLGAQDLLNGALKQLELAGVSKAEANSFFVHRATWDGKRPTTAAEAEATTKLKRPRVSSDQAASEAWNAKERAARIATREMAEANADNPYLSGKFTRKSRK
jgi:hypothetical protein